MANVLLSKEFQAGLDVDGSLKGKAFDFLRKLLEDADRAGLDLKLPKGAADPRVRTARVDLNYRAVLFAAGRGEAETLVLAAIRPHDDAYRYAERIQMRVNPANGTFEIFDEERVRSGTSSLHDGKASHDHDRSPRRDHLDRPRLLPFSVDELVGLGLFPDVAAAAVGSGTTTSCRRCVRLSRSGRASPCSTSPAAYRWTRSPGPTYPTTRCPRPVVRRVRLTI